MGRGDGMIGAVEAQKAEDGVLHIHLFLFLQTICQFLTLQELADQLRAGMLSAEAYEAYISHVRCAAYPNQDQFLQEREEIERIWPAFSSDYSLCALPNFFWTGLYESAATWRS